MLREKEAFTVLSLEIDIQNKSKKYSVAIQAPHQNKTRLLCISFYPCCVQMMPQESSMKVDM